VHHSTSEEDAMRILLAYDGADHSQPALDEVAKIAMEEDNVYVGILSVVAPEDAPTRFATGERPHAHEHVERAHAYLRERGIVADMKVDAGDPAEKIIDEAGEGGYDLIVTGTRGRGPVARLLLGSVSHKLADETPCPLLVVSDEHRLRVEPSR
jgi:nucleotide-binding universal stress UspA family protein